MSFDELIRRNIIKGWDWYKLSSNPNITMEIIIDNPYVLFDKKGLLQNSSITIQDIETKNNNEDVSEDTGFDFDEL
jgi:hypothetical protein